MKKVLLLLLVFVLFQKSFSQNFKVQAIMTYNFTNYLTWSESDEMKFTIGVYGEGEFLNEMKIISKNFKVKNKEIEVLEFNKVEDIQNCRILYVQENKNDELENIMGAIELYSTVLITDNAKDIQTGNDINFIIEEGKQKFEIYPSNIQKKSIQIDQQLIDMGIVKKDK